MNGPSDFDVERCLKFLIVAFGKSGEHRKPVVFHSIKVGLHLYYRGYRKEVVLGGFLHDVLEEAEVSREQLAREFGSEICRFVEANTYDETIKDRKLQYIEAFDRSYRSGKEALIIRAADALDTIDYYANDDVKKKTNAKDLALMLTKCKYFIDSSAGVIGEEPIYRDLKGRFDLHLHTKYKGLRLDSGE